MSTLIVIAGPTASGKTRLALHLAQYFSTEILSADSRQFFQGMNIGTAKPSHEELLSVKHHFVDSLELTRLYNAAEFERDALEILKNIFEHNQVAILVGGSGLYIRALCEGIDESPGRDENIRQQVQEIYETKGFSGLQEKLKDLDPEYYSTVDLSNKHRIIRALEVCMSSGKKFSGMRKHTAAVRDFRILKIGLMIPREELYRRIDQRVDEMIDAGLVDEVRNLLPYRHFNSLHTVGYTELFDYFDNKLSLEETIQKIKKNSRNYAKRQMTWFRKDPSIHWCDPADPNQILQWISQQINS